VRATPTPRQARSPQTPPSAARQCTYRTCAPRHCCTIVCRVACTRCSTEGGVQVKVEVVVLSTAHAERTRSSLLAVGRCLVGCVHSVTGCTAETAGRRAVRGGGTAHNRAARLSQALPTLRHQARTLQRLSCLDPLSLFIRWTLYDWNTLLVCWIATRQMGHDGFLICVSLFAHASHTHTW
jgi:hypothetical protein